jgi:chemosensory pili system protein ChpE
MLNLIGLGIIMGLTFALPPGVVTAETLRRGITRGFPAALGVQLGSLIGDATYAILALAGLAILVQNPILQRVLGAVGALFILYQASQGLMHALTATPTTTSTSAPISDKQSAFTTGALLSLTNPWAIGYWIGPGGALATVGATESFSAMSVFFISFFGVCVTYAFTVALLVGWTQRALSAQTGRIISIASSLAIGALGLWLAYRVIQMMG